MGGEVHFPQIYIKIEGTSARFCRELYTHIGRSPTRLQASTRYIPYEKGFEYIIPPHIENNKEALKIYNKTMDKIVKAASELKDLGIPREDAANLLPLGMTSTMVMRTNLRMLIDMSKQRMCARALWEFRDFMDLLIKELSAYSDDYKILTEEFFKAKCEDLGYCPEGKNSCGKHKPR